MVDIWKEIKHTHPSSKWTGGASNLAASPGRSRSVRGFFTEGSDMAVDLMSSIFWLLG